MESFTVLTDFTFENGRTAHDKVLCWEKEALVSSASVAKDDAISKAWPFFSCAGGLRRVGSADSLSFV